MLMSNKFSNIKQKVVGKVSLVSSLNSDFISMGHSYFFESSTSIQPPGHARELKGERPPLPPTQEGSRPGLYQPGETTPKLQCVHRDAN